MKNVLFAFLILLSGCVSAGSNFDETKVSSLKVGMSESEVISALGSPNGRSYMANGGQVLVWLHSQANAFGGAKAKSVTVIFDSEHKMMRVGGETSIKSN